MLNIRFANNPLNSLPQPNQAYLLHSIALKTEKYELGRERSGQSATVYLPKNRQKNMGVKKSGWGSLMKHEEHRQEIEPNVLALGAVFAATLLGMILWTIS